MTKNLIYKHQTENLTLYANHPNKPIHAWQAAKLLVVCKPMISTILQ